MPAMVGGFGKKYVNYIILSWKMALFTLIPLKRVLSQNSFSYLKFMSSSYNNNNNNNYNSNLSTRKHAIKIQLAPYLSGLIEGDGTFAVHDTNSMAKKYNPMIIVVFKKADLPLANYLCGLTQCGKVYVKSERGYVLWQISDIVSVFKICCIINGYMRTPKHESLNRAISWFNQYIIINKDSKLTSTKSILSIIYPIECKPLDDSAIDSNSWLAGFTDADGNFSINIHKRKNKNYTRVQPCFSLEIRQTYHRINNHISESSSNNVGDNKSQKTITLSPTHKGMTGGEEGYFYIMSKIANYFKVNLYNRSRTLNNKVFSSFTIMAHNQNSLYISINYFNKYPLLSSKYLDYLDWLTIVELRRMNVNTLSYLDKAIITRKDFNKSRTTFTWNHLKNCYIDNDK
jgi:hypothetical protein